MTPRQQSMAYWEGPQYWLSCQCLGASKENTWFLTFYSLGGWKSKHLYYIQFRAIWEIGGETEMTVFVWSQSGKRNRSRFGGKKFNLAYSKAAHSRWECPGANSSPETLIQPCTMVQHSCRVQSQPDISCAMLKADKLCSARDLLSKVD